MHAQLCVLILVFASLPAAFAQDKANKSEKQARSTKASKVVYGSAPWNKDSKKIDQAFMFVRDKNSNKTAKILLEETEPDSSIFTGQFTIDFRSNKPAALEVYIPPENMRDDDKAITRFNQLLNEKKVRPSPMVVKDENGSRTYDIYDTAQQAERALKAYQDQVKKSQEAERTKNVKPLPNEQALETAQLAERERILAELAKAAAEREAQRVRLEQLEAQRLQKMREEKARLDAAEKRRRLALARQWAEKGIAAYHRNDYREAEVAFVKSVELDPDNRDYYFMYGVSLYRNEKLDQALVALKVAPPNPATDLEKAYYMGLIHYKLTEFPAAVEKFRQVKNAGHSVLSASAAFYEGVVHFSEENFTAAQNAFEWVLDHSNDPALDRKAEEYIEKIAMAMQAKKEAARKWAINASGGVTYDSNILYSPDNDQAQAKAIDDGGIRVLLMGSADYRVFYTTTRDMSIKGSTLYMYSLDSQFAKADPFLNTIGTPYTFKGVMGGRGYKWTLTPAYETLFMDAEGEGTRKNILNTLVMNSDLTLIMRDNYFASYTLEVRKDDSNLASQQGDNELSAMKYTLKTQHIHLLDNTKKRALILNAGLVLNNAEGKNKKYQRLDFGATYSAPWNKFTNTTWNAGFTGYKVDYPDGTDDRADTNLGLTLGMNKNLDKNWGWGLTANYTNNASSNESNQYSKYTILSMINYNWAE